ncbi:membrane protein [Devosia pacifica]|uniref:Membrane protein n=1 Tax=Devosia pacifica TaxID=1335967 RepID=A0A918VRR4_9HYPH|nr:DUF2244 domain-containing protein [Devosia pacifica]GHA23193.1 membrane protein [Devosia pacifica]
MQVTTAPLFAAELTPHRSMNARGLRIVVVLFALLSALPGLVFFSLGAWPIVGFMGLDIVAMAVALWFSFDRGKRKERVTLWSEQLEIVSFDAKGRESRQQFDPLTVKLVLDRDINEKTTALRLRAPDREAEIGAFLSQEDKTSFSKAFGSALRKARA